MKVHPEISMKTKGRENKCRVSVEGVRERVRGLELDFRCQKR
jgi:hypothetical protein